MIHSKALAPGLKDIKKQEVTRIGTDDALANTGKLISEREIQNVKRTLSLWKRKGRGQDLVVALVFLVVLGAMGAAAVMITGGDLKISGNYKKSEQAFYMAEGGAEYGVGMLRQLLNSKLHVSTSDLNLAAPTMSVYAFNVFSIEKEGSVVESPISSGNFAGLSAYIQNYKITSEARVTGTNAKTKIVQHADDYLVPLFQFGIFYEKDLEILPGPNMTFSGGRIQSNRGIDISLG